jgi:hypothetical protein
MSMLMSYCFLLGRGAEEIRTNAVSSGAQLDLAQGNWNLRIHTMTVQPCHATGSLEQRIWEAEGEVDQLNSGDPKLLVTFVLAPRACSLKPREIDKMIPNGMWTSLDTRIPKMAVMNRLTGDINQSLLIWSVASSGVLDALRWRHTSRMMRRKWKKRKGAESGF